MIEYGVESTLNRTLERINRQHTYEESDQMIRKTAERGIIVGAHMILGLPGETREELLHHADVLSGLPLTTLKLHHVIIRGTPWQRSTVYSRIVPSFELDDILISA